jgi:hypothetical protein
MGKIYPQKPVKLIIGFIFKDETVFSKALVRLAKRFGKIDFESALLPFTYTSYYEKEMGTGLSRKFVSFKKLIPPEKLAEIKLITNRLEQRLASGNNRLINIDPGYIDLAKLVLATTKDFRHRVFLGRGIYAEVTLFYTKKTQDPQSGFTHWDWTYPDYRTPEYIGIFNRIREIYAQQKQI